MEHRIYFNYSDKKLTGIKTTPLKNNIASLLKKEGVKRSHIQYIFCSDEYLLDINKQFLQHDYYTDIITFDLSDNASALLEGEIYISIDRVKDNAKTQQTDWKEELKRVLYHGVLHLCGYKDKTPKDEKQMRSKEEEYLKMFDGYTV